MMRTLLQLTAMCWMLSAYLEAADSAVAIRRSGKAEPYRLAEEAARKVLVDAGMTVGTEENASVLIAVGSSAAEYLLDHRSPEQVLIYVLVADPHGIGLTEAPATAGVLMTVPLQEQFKVVDELLPRGRNIGMLYNSDHASSRKLRDAALAAAPKGWRVQAKDIAAYDSIATAISAVIEDGADIIWTAPDPAVFDRLAVRSLLVGSLRHRAPVFGFSQSFVRSGAVIGVGVDAAAAGRSAAGIAVRAMAGDIPDKPVTPPYDIYLNPLVVDKIRLHIPGPLRARTTEITHER